MFARWGVVVLWSVATEAIRQHGTAPYANSTAPLTLSSVPSDGISTVTSSRISNEAEYTPTATLGCVNVTCIANGTNSTTATSSCTVNVPNAKLDWWYAATYSSAKGTFTTLAPNVTSDAGNYLTVISGTDTFDASSAISTDFAWTESIVDDPVWGPWTNYEAYLVIPTAAATSVITRDAATPLPSGNIIPVTDVNSYLWMEEMPPASITLFGAGNATSTITSATPFLYFTAYEIESALNGTVTTSTVELAQPTAIEYSVKDIENYAAVTDTVPEDFLLSINQSACSPGTVWAEVTVLVVLDVYWTRTVPYQWPQLIHIESSVLGFEVTDTDKVVFAETSGGAIFSMGANDPKWTEDLGKTTAADDPPNLQTIRSQTSQGPQQTAPPAPPVHITVGSVGTKHVIVAPSSVVMIGTQTVTPGSSAVTIDGSQVSVAPSATAIVVNGSTSALPIVAGPGSSTQSVGNVGGRPVVLNPSSAVIVGTATLKPGQPPVTIGGTTVSVAPLGSAIVIGGTVSALPRVIFPTETVQSQAPVAPILTIGHSTFTANAATQFYISPGQTLTPGGTAIVDGTAVSLGPSGSFVVVGTSTRMLSADTTEATYRPEVVFDGVTITALPSNDNHNRHGLAPLDGEDIPSGPTFVISGQTLAPGHAITVDGTTVSLGFSGSLIVVNGVTSTISDAAQITAPPITIGGNVYTPVPGTAGSYMLGTVLLTPGGEVTMSGTTISLASDGLDIVVDGVTSTLGGPVHAAMTNPPLISIDSQTYTAVPGLGTTFIIQGNTLTPGGTITVDGNTIYLAPGATELVYGSDGKSTTEVLFPATTTRRPFITGSASAPANAGASGSNGQAATTSSAVGTGCSLQMPKTTTWMFFVMVGGFGLWMP